MTGIDKDVLEEQCVVLRDARELHQETLEETIAIEARAMLTEQIAHDEATAAAAVEAEAHCLVMSMRVMQAEQRRAVRECSADLAAIREVLAGLEQRQPSSGS